MLFMDNMDSSDDSSTDVSDYTLASDMGDYMDVYSGENLASPYSIPIGSFRIGARMYGRFSDTTSSSSNSDSETSTEEECYEIDEQTKSAVCDHNYLGELEQVRGRVLIEDDSVLRIPLVYLDSSFVLVPGQTLPLIINESSIINILKSTIQSNEAVFGVFPVKLLAPSIVEDKIIGTLAEIIAYGDTERGFIVKAIGRQRFEMIKVEQLGARFVLFAHVRILPEITQLPVLHHYHLPSLNRFRSKQRLMCSRREASQSPWPEWVHRIHDKEHIVKRVKQRMTSHFRMSKSIKYSDDATTLFFQILRCMPVQLPFTKMQEGMALNNPIHRLNWLKSKMFKLQGDKLKCVRCRAATIGKTSDIFSLSVEGPQGLYAYYNRYVYELITFKKVEYVVGRGSPQSSCSWFPKYTWQPLCCLKCKSDVGWKYVATEEHLIPRVFYGISKESLAVEDKRKN